MSKQKTAGKLFWHQFSGNKILERTIFWKYLSPKISSYMVYVTGYWKTDHNVTLGQLHFIGPANSHTHALSMH